MQVSGLLLPPWIRLVAMLRHLLDIRQGLYCADSESLNIARQDESDYEDLEKESNVGRRVTPTS